MQIIVDGRLLSPHQTGISRYAEQIIDHYILKAGKNNVRVLCNHYIPEKYSSINIKCPFRPYSLVDWVRLPDFLEQFSAELLHFPQYSGVWRPLKRSRIVMTVHDLMFRKVNGFFFDQVMLNRLAVFSFELMIKRSLKQADQIIAVSQTTQSDLMELGGFESVVIREGLNEVESETKKNYNALSKYGLRAGAFFLYAGNLRPQKNIPFLIECFLKSGVEADLVLCGQARNKDLRKIKPSVAIHPSIKILGFIPDEELLQLYKNCKAFVYPSLYEGFGLPILEALAQGAVVYSSSAGALKEFKESGIHFFNPENQDSLTELFKSGDRNENKSSPDISAKFNWREPLEKTWELINAVVKS